jgi:hypothetical protein
VTVPRTRTGFSGRTRNPASRRGAYIASFLILSFGIALLTGGISRHNAAQPFAGGRTATGTIIAVDTGQTCERHRCSRYWVPTIQFAANGDNFTFTGPQSVTSLTTGDRVRVSYDPSNPDSARDLTAGDDFAWPQIWFGTLLILFGAGYFLRSMLRARD